MRGSLRGASPNGVAKSKRALAVAAGAIEVDRYQMAGVIQGNADPLRLIRPLADPMKAFAPALHVPAWLAAQLAGTQGPQRELNPPFALVRGAS